MSITPIAFNNALGTTPTETYADLATDADIRALHPDMDANRWESVNNFRATLSAAFDRLLLDLVDQSWTAALIPNTATNRAWFKQAVIAGAMVMICRDFRGEQGDRWDMLLNDYHNRYNAMTRNPAIDYDLDEDGSIADTEEGMTGEVRLMR